MLAAYTPPPTLTDVDSDTRQHHQFTVLTAQLTALGVAFGEDYLDAVAKQPYGLARVLRAAFPGFVHWLARRGASSVCALGPTAAYDGGHCARRGDRARRERRGDRAAPQGGAARPAATARAGARAAGQKEAASAAGCGGRRTRRAA